MKNKLIDLNNHLFAQLERLGDEDLKGDELKNEIARGKAIASVAKETVNNARVALDARRMLGDNIIDNVPEMIGIELQP